MAVRARLTTSERRKFAYTVGLAFVVLGAIFAWRWGVKIGSVPWTIGGVLLVMGVVVPTRLGGVSHAWMRFGEAISRVTSPIIMGVMYYLVITPIGFLLRLTGKNPLRHQGVDDGYWLTTKKQGAEDLENQF